MPEPTTLGPHTAYVRSFSADRHTGLGREGMATVWDDEGRYLGCMGIRTWEGLLHAGEGDVGVAGTAPAAPREPVARVYREGWGSWWAELWTPPPPGHEPDDANPLLAMKNPPPVPGMVRAGLSLHSMKRGAVRSANAMRERYLAGRAVDPADDPKQVYHV